LLIFVCIFLALVIGIGSFAGIYLAIKNSKTAVKLGSVSVSEGSARFLVSTFKSDYIALLSNNKIAAYDSERFWNKEAEAGTTYRDMLDSYIKDRLLSLAASASIYKDTLGKNDAREVAEKTAENILSLRFDGDKSKFNTEAEPYGFEYDDYIEAIELLYCESAAMESIYGENGKNLESYPEQCVDYLDNFVRVKILFLMENDRYSLDENKNYIENPDDGGETALTHPMSESEKAARAALIERLRSLVSGTGGESMTENTVDYYQKSATGDYEKSDGDPYWPDGEYIGYYFNKSSRATALFSKRYEGVVEAAFDMKVGEYRIVDCPTIDGVCLLYRCNTESKAYKNEENPFFADFYENAASHLYGEVIEAYRSEISYGKPYSEIDLITQKKSSKFDVYAFVK
jgi:hypothetical protein